MTTWLLFLTLGTAPVPAPAPPFTSLSECERAGAALSAPEIVPATSIPELRMRGYICIPRDDQQPTR